MISAPISAPPYVVALALTHRDARTPIALLDHFNELLESGIESSTLDGKIARDCDRGLYEMLRRDIRLRRRSEEVLIQLCNQVEATK